MSLAHSGSRLQQHEPCNCDQRSAIMLALDPGQALYTSPAASSASVCRPESPSLERQPRSLAARGMSTGGARHGRNNASRPAGRMSSLAARRERSLRGGHRQPLYVCWVCSLAKHLAPIVNYQASSIEHRASSTKHRALTDVCCAAGSTTSRHCGLLASVARERRPRSALRLGLLSPHRLAIRYALLPCPPVFVYSSSLAARADGSAMASKSVRPC